MSYGGLSKPPVLKFLSFLLQVWFKIHNNALVKMAPSKGTFARVLNDVDAENVFVCEKIT